MEIIGTTIFANYGAMSPVYELKITGIDEHKNLICENDIDDMATFIKLDEIRSERPSSGSPIGIYFNEMEAY